MARDDFSARIDRLARDVGDGVLSGRITVDQKYAQAQHEETGWRHEPGRTHHYLSRPLMDRADEWLGRLARSAITARGSDLTGGMREVVEDLTAASQAVTPIDENDLPRSHARRVVDGGRTVYERPAQVRRLTDAELAAKRRRRGRGRR